MGEFDGLREAASKATPGPWLHDEAGYRAPEWPDDMHYRRVVRGEPHPVSGWRECVVSTHGAVDDTPGARAHEATATYIAAASPDVVLRLIERVEAAEAAVERVQALVDGMRPGLSHEPVDCTDHCQWGDCDCSGIARVLAWTGVSPDDLRAALGGDR